MEATAGARAGRPAPGCYNKPHYTSATTTPRFTMRPSRSTTSPSAGPRSRFSAAQPGVDASTAAARRSSAIQAATHAAVAEHDTPASNAAPVSDPRPAAHAMAVSAAAPPAKAGHDAPGTAVPAPPQAAWATGRGRDPVGRAALA